MIFSKNSCLPEESLHKLKVILNNIYVIFKLQIPYYNFSIILHRKSYQIFFAQRADLRLVTYNTHIHTRKYTSRVFYTAGICCGTISGIRNFSSRSKCSIKNQTCVRNSPPFRSCLAWFFP